MTITGCMRKHLTERICSNPREVAEDIARCDNRATYREDLDQDELAARLACWVAGEADAYVNIDDEDDWSLIALMAELAASTMLAQRRVIAISLEREFVRVRPTVKAE